MKNMILVSIVTSLALLSGCAHNDIDTSALNRFRNDNKAIDEFESRNGKIGAYAVPVFAAQAAQYLGVPFRQVEQSLLVDYKHLDVTANSSISFEDGWYALMIKDADSGQYGAFGKVTFRNTSTAKSVMLIEALGPDGTSLSFQYIQMEPGDTYVFEHNVAPLIILLGGVSAKKAAVAVGMAVMAGLGAKLDDFIEDMGATIDNCKLLNPNWGKDYCKGKCPPGTSCKTATTKSYWKWGTQAATCGCQ